MAELTLREQSAFNYWYPQIQGLLIPTPKTRFIKLNEKTQLKLWSNTLTLLNIQKSIIEMLQQFNITSHFNDGNAVFIRTEHVSGKHNFKNTCYLEKLQDLIPHLQNLLLASEIESTS